MSPDVRQFALRLVAIMTFSIAVGVGLVILGVGFWPRMVVAFVIGFFGMAVLDKVRGPIGN